MRDDVAVNFAYADRVNERANGIERELSAIQRQIQRLQSDVRSLKGEPWVSADVKLQTGLVDRTGTTQAGASGGGRV
jgi:hypothetical protein